MLNASTKETERFFRLTQEHQKRKIDAAVALSFAIRAAVRNGRPFDTEEILKNYREPEIDTKFTGWEKW